MAGMYTRDTVKITPVTRDPGLGSGTDGTPVTTGAMVENTTDLGSGNGRPEGSEIYIFLDPDEVVKKGDKIQVTKMFGNPVTEKERLVIQATRYGHWRQSHWEVYA